MELRSGPSVLAIIGVTALIGLGAAGYVALRQPRAHQEQVAEVIPTTTVTLPVEGMSCSSCVASVKRTVKGLNGVTSVEVSLAERRARVSYDSSKVTPDHIVAAIRELGYKTGPPVPEAGK